MEKVLLKKIQPDPNNPRQLFAADKMHMLKESIKREGIITPLVVEKVGDGYILVDGERRFRAATDLGLKEVPVIVEETRSATDRKLRQFAVQEQHEAWTPIEKAKALDSLADELGLPLFEVCKLLNISATNARRYVAFSRLADKDHYVKSEVPLDFVTYINAVRSKARAISFNVLEKEFTRSDEKKLERRMIENIKEGAIVNRRDITKLGYAFTKNAKTITEYLTNPKATPESLFLKSGAKGAQNLNNVNLNATYLASHIQKFMAVQDVEVPAATIRNVKAAKEAATKFLQAFDN